MEKLTKQEIIEEAYKLGMKQNAYEIENAFDFVSELKIKDFMEIGTDQGGTFLVWSRIAGTNGYKISVDLAHGPWGINTFNIDQRNAKMRTLGNNVHIFDGDSHSEGMHHLISGLLTTNKLDLLFIDGDHSHQGVKLDFHMYKQFVKPGGWIGFHDIKDTETHHNGNCFVDRLWAELPQKKVWFNADNDWGGIGFIQI